MVPSPVFFVAAATAAAIATTAASPTLVDPYLEDIHLAESFNFPRLLHPGGDDDGLAGGPDAAADARLLAAAARARQGGEPRTARGWDLDELVGEGGVGAEQQRAVENRIEEYFWRKTRPQVVGEVEGETRAPFLYRRGNDVDATGAEVFEVAETVVVEERDDPPVLVEYSVVEGPGGRKLARKLWRKRRRRVGAAAGDDSPAPTDRWRPILPGSRFYSLREEAANGVDSGPNRRRLLVNTTEDGPPDPSATASYRPDYTDVLEQDQIDVLVDDTTASRSPNAVDGDTEITTQKDLEILKVTPEEGRPRPKKHTNIDQLTAPKPPASNPAESRKRSTPNPTSTATTTTSTTTYIPTTTITTTIATAAALPATALAELKKLPFYGSSTSTTTSRPVYPSTPVSKSPSPGPAAPSTTSPPYFYNAEEVPIFEEVIGNAFRDNMERAGGPRQQDPQPDYHQAGGPRPARTPATTTAASSTGTIFWEEVQEHHHKRPRPGPEADRLELGLPHMPYIPGHRFPPVVRHISSATRRLPFPGPVPSQDLAGAGGAAGDPVYDGGARQPRRVAHPGAVDFGAATGGEGSFGWYLDAPVSLA